MTHSSALSVMLSVLVLSMPAGLAEIAQKPKEPNLQLSVASPGSEEDQKIRLARKLIREKNYQAASALLETVYEQEKDKPVVLNLLLDCYNYMGYFVKSEMLTRHLVESFPQNYSCRVRLAEVLARQGKIDEAKAAYDKTISLLPDVGLGAYQIVLRSMVSYGFDSLALDLIDTVRERSADTSLFALERGKILEEREEYRPAALEFFVLLNDTGRVASEAEKRLLALFDYPQSSAEVEKTLLEQVTKTVNFRAAKILSSFYLKAGQFERAFDFAVLQDSLGGQTGNSLMLFMRSCRERKLYTQLTRMAEYILSRYRNRPVIGDTYFLYADALVQLGRFDEAIATYDSIVAVFPRPQDKADALFQIGSIYLNNLNDCSRALTVFDSVVTHYRAGRGYLNARLARPYCYLREGRLDKARTGFENILNSRLNEDMKEEVEYNLALIFFFDRKFDSSQVALRKLMVDYPRGFYINDALLLLVLVGEADGASSLLNDFSDALLFEQMRLPDSTTARLLLIAQDPNQALADVALYKLATLSVDRSDSTKAIEYIDRLAANFPESYYLPYGLKTKADIYVSRLDGIEQAKSIYRHLLEKYPNYPFTSEVRKKMRQLEGEV